MIELACKNCKNNFRVYKYRAKSAKYCSNKCRGIDFATKYKGENNPCWRGGKPKCKECGKECFNRDATHCGECSNTKVKHNWKGGISLGEKRKKYVSDKNREWLKNNREKKLCMVAARRAKKFANGGSHTLAEWEQLKKTYGYMCLCCKKQEPIIVLSEDHIVPLSLGGTDDIWNIQPLCRSCNSIKSVHIVDYRTEVMGLIN